MRRQDPEVLEAQRGGGASPPGPISKPRLRALALGQSRRRSAELRESASAESEAVLSGPWLTRAEVVLCYVALPDRGAYRGPDEAARRPGARRRGAPRRRCASLRFHAGAGAGLPAMCAGTLGRPRAASGDARRARARPGSERTLVSCPGSVRRRGLQAGAGRRPLRPLSGAGPWRVPRVVSSGLCFDEQLVGAGPARSVG